MEFRRHVRTPFALTHQGDKGTQLCLKDARQLGGSVTSVLNTTTNPRNSYKNVLIFRACDELKFIEAEFFFLMFIFNSTNRSESELCCEVPMPAHERLWICGE